MEHKFSQTQIQKTFIFVLPITIKKIMGSTQSKIQVLDITSQKLQKHLFIEPTIYVQPFRKFSSEYHKKASGSQHQFITRIKAPEEDQTLSLTQLRFQQIEEAFEQKTKNFQIQSIIFDDYYTNRVTYVVKDLELTKTVLIRQFQTYESHIFGNIACEVSISEEIAKLSSKNLLKLRESYLIENDEIKFQNPKTQVLQFQGVAASLAQIIKYRRQNNWEWNQAEFNQLVYDLISGLSALHKADICHNDIRPDNLFYSTLNKCYVIGNFSYATKNATIGNLRNNRASKNYVSPEANSNEQFDFRKADVYSLGATLLCALYLCNPIDVQQSLKFGNRYKAIAGYKVITEMIKSEQQRRQISHYLQNLPNPHYENKSMDNLIESLRYKIKPRNNNQKIYKQASSEFFKRLGLWQEWRLQVDQILQSHHNLTNFQTAELYEQLALIHYCQDDLDESTMFAKKSAKLSRQMGQQAFKEGDYNLAIKNFKHALETSRFYVNPYDIDIAKSLICLSKVHAEKRQEQFSTTLLKQAKDLIVKQSSQDSILYSEMKIKEAELSKKFFHYQEAVDHLNEALNTAKKMEPINAKSSKLCQAKIRTLMAECQILISRKNPVDEKTTQRLQKAEDYLNQSKNIYESLEEIDCHLQLAENTQILGQLNVQKKDFPQAKLCFEKSLQMRRQYQQSRSQAPWIAQHGVTLSNLGKCERIMNVEKDSDIYKQALNHQEQALQIFRKVYGSDHNYHSAVVLKEMGELYDAMQKSQKSIDCFKCSKQILSDLYGERSPYDQIGDPQKMLRN